MMDGNSAAALPVLGVVLVIAVFVLHGLVGRLDRNQGLLAVGLIVVIGFAAGTWNAVVGAVILGAGFVCAAIAGLAAVIHDGLDKIGRARKARAAAEAEATADFRAQALDRLEAIEAELVALNGRRRRAQEAPRS